MPPPRKRRQFVRFRCLFSLLSTVRSTSPFPPPLPNLTSIQLVVARVDSPGPPTSGCLDRLRDAGGPCRRRISRPFRGPVGCRRSGLDPRTGLQFSDLLPSMAALVELFLGSTSATVDWEAEAYPTYGDFAVLPLLVAFFPAVRFLLDRLVFEVISCSLEVPWIRNARAKLRLGSWSVTDGM